MHEPPARFSERKKWNRPGPRFKTKRELAAIQRAKQKKRERLKEKRREKAKAKVRAYAAENRRQMTPEEAMLWERLRQWPKPFKCRAQHPIGMRIADFAFCEQRLIVEVDGGYHLNPAQRASDYMRTKYLERCGFKVVRFNNEQVTHQLEDVIEAISVGIGRTNIPDALEEGDHNLWS